MNAGLRALIVDPIVDPERATRHLLAGGVGVLPTDTVYGLAARAHDQQAVLRLYELKSRERKPGTVIAASVEQVRGLGVDDHVLEYIKHFWAKPVSVVLPLPQAMRYLDQGLGDIAIRVVSEPKLHSLLLQTGPLLTSSANLPGEPVSETIEQAWGYFGTRLDFYMDGGDLKGNLSSTLIKPLENDGLTVLRVGAVSAAEIAALAKNS